MRASMHRESPQSPRLYVRLVVERKQDVCPQGFVGSTTTQFKDDPMGLGVLTSIQLMLPSGSLWIMGMYWLVPGSIG